MSLFRRLTILSSAVLFTGMAYGADVDDEDIQALRDWVNSKRMITVKELGGQLSISGEVHAEMQATNNTKNGKPVHGNGTRHEYDIEFNLALDYRTENTWSAARIRFDNDAGIRNEHFGSGSFDKIRVDRAYFGYRLIDGDRHSMDIEVGRRAMFNIFDSKIQFASNFDGVNFKDTYAIDKVGDVYYQVGAFIVNEKHDQAAYVGEVGILNVANTGFYTKYSLIDWDTKHVNYGKKVEEFKKIPEVFHFINSQLILGYKFIPQPWDKVVNIYLGGLYNHRARGHKITNHKRANFGGYTGFSVGQIKQRGDWNFEAIYQVVAAQAIPSFDVLGIGTGANGHNGLYYFELTEQEKKKLNVKDKVVPATKASQAESNTNFRGYKLTLQYMLTNNLNLFQEWSQSITLDDHIGPFKRFKQYELELIYAF